MNDSATTLPADAPGAPPAGSVASGGLPGATSEALAAEWAPARRGLSARVSYGVLLASHAIVDIFPIFFTTLMIVFQDRFQLRSWQEQAIYMATPIFSGLLQPLFAWTADRYDTRLSGPAGLALGALCVGSIGFAQNFWQLITLQIVGVIGTGMYHPISPAMAGHLGGQVFTRGRAMAVGVFIAAGMIGQSAGPIIATRITSSSAGMAGLALLIPPAILAAIVLHLVIGPLKHRHDDHAAAHAAVPRDEVRQRWRMVLLLTGQNCLRFTANVGMFVMFNEWVKTRIAPAVHLLDDPAARTAAAKASAEVVGTLSSAMTLGMGICVVLVGRVIRPGHEKWPLLWFSLVGAAFMAVAGLAGEVMVPEVRVVVRAEDGGFALANPITLLEIAPMCLCVMLAAIGFFATFPLSASLGQRLLPSHTSLVTSLLMGVGWAFSSLCAPFAAIVIGAFHTVGGEPAPLRGVHAGFLGFAALLVVAGTSSLLLPTALVRRLADRH